MSAPHLLTFAHRPEADAFLRHFELIKHHSFDWLYLNDRIVLAITGEGIQEALSRTAISLGLFPKVNRVINMGVAGALNNKVSIGSIYSIRSIFAFDERPHFKSFNSNGDVDLVTSGSRVLTTDPLPKLMAMGQIVDREAWGVAFAAKEAGVKLSSYKYISDFAGTLEACEPVKAMAANASESLLEYYLSLNFNQVQEDTFVLEGFHFTFTQQQELKKLLHLLAIKFNNEKESWLKSEKVRDLLEQKITPKERSKELLSHLRSHLDQFASSKREHLASLFAPLKREQVEVQELGKAETSDLRITFTFSDQKSLEHKIQTVQDFDFERYYRFWRGEEP